MNEKQKLEKGTAEGFLTLYNAQFGTDFRLVELADAPDARCADSKGQPLNLEITMIEDRPLDIKFLLGRSNSRSVEALEAHLEKVRQGEEQPMFGSLSDEVSENLVMRVEAKLQNSYGSDVALVVRVMSGADWDWDLVASDLRERLDLSRNPFDRGIWIISWAKNRLFRIV